MSNKSLLSVGVGLTMLVSVSAALAKPNQAFLTDAIQGNLAEISMGQLAQKNGGSDGVRSFGQMLVQDHSAANEKANALAQAQGVAPPIAPKPEAKTDFDRMSNLNGDAFDKEFAKHLVADHKKDIAEFEKEAKDGKDAQVKAWATATLPTLKHHLEMIQGIQAKMK